MIARSVTPPDRLSSSGASDPLRSLAELLGVSITSCAGIQLEAPGTNPGTLAYGTKAAQPMSLAAGEQTSVLPITSLQNLYIVGDGSSTVSVLIFQ